MYVCEMCESIFSRPEVEYIDDEREYGEVCPYCGSTDIGSFQEEIDR